MSDHFGPNTAQIEALIARIRTLTEAEAEALAAARDTRVAAWEAARSAAWYARSAAWDAALDAAWDAADQRATAWKATWGAALALVVRDLISAADFDLLTEPWRDVIGATWEVDA